MEKAAILILNLAALLLLLVHCVQGQRVSLNSRIERLALLDLRSSLGLTTTDWPIKGDPCTSWRGIRCRNGRVIEMNISGFRRTRVGRLNPGFNVDSIGNLTFLEVFNASGFWLPGSIPDWFGFRVGSLQVLDLRSSLVTGGISNSVGNLSRLSELYLSGNRITGNIPDSLGQLGQLKILDLSRNLLTGDIPVGFGLLGNLTRLDLSFNYLSGSIPTGLGSLSRLEFLDLSDNSLAGSIPVELAGLTELVLVDLGRNSFLGSMPDSLFRIEKLEEVVVRGNELSGVLPQEVWSLPGLRVLDVSSNKFTGNLPSFDSNGSVNGAIYNLSNNLFYGNLSAVSSHFRLIDLSGNYIQGKVPYSSAANLTLDRNCLKSLPNQRNSADCKLFYGERGLIFDNFTSPEPIQPPFPKPVSKINKQWIYILVGLLGGIFIVIMVVLMILVLRKCKNKTVVSQHGSADVGPIPEEKSPSQPKDSGVISSHRASYAYAQLLLLTDEFSEMSLIKHGHSGDLYQGLLDGTQMVIKRVKWQSMNKESYAAELKFISKYKHSRLVPFLGHCLEKENEKFLVYKYMPNGDLASYLNRLTDSEDGSLQPLDWITRLKIAIEAAEGLSFLHHECSPPIVHRDVQSSSILLDDKFEVRLGSLSEVRAQEGDLHLNVFARFSRRSQSSEQDYSGSSPATCSYDVYCFGKVLLELVTGKLVTSKTDDATAREWLEHTLSCISLYDKKMVTRIVDPSLIIDDDLFEEVWAMAIIAWSCLHPRPTKRPPMKYILRALENPLKVVRDESFSSGKLRTTSSRRSWSAAIFGSRQDSASDNAAPAEHTNRECINGLKQVGRVGSIGSGGIECSSSIRRSSNEIFPEPLEVQDLDKVDKH